MHACMDWHRISVSPNLAAVEVDELSTVSSKSVWTRMVGFLKAFQLYASIQASYSAGESVISFGAILANCFLTHDVTTCFLSCLYIYIGIYINLQFLFLFHVMPNWFVL